jgi:hypothetical protein
MMRHLCTGLALLTFTATMAQAQSVEIRNAEFGIFDASNPKETVFEPALVVPHLPGQRYGWVIELRTTQRSVAVREEYLIAPTEAFKEEAGGQRLTIPHERRNQVSQRQLVPVAGRIHGEWEIGPREPPGKRRLQVLVEDRPPVVFEYEVK